MSRRKPFVIMPLANPRVQRNPLLPPPCPGSGEPKKRMRFDIDGTATARCSVCGLIVKVRVNKTLYAHQPPKEEPEELAVQEEKPQKEQLPELECLHCGRRWHPRLETRPVKCQGCYSPNWDKPPLYRRKKKGEEAKGGEGE